MTENHSTTGNQNPENFPQIPDEDKNNAAMSYFLLMAPVLYLNRKDSDFIQFHAKQGSILLGLFVIFWILSEFNHFIFGIFHILNFGVVALAVLGFIKAIRGDFYSIPLIGEISKNGLSPEKIAKGTLHAGKISGKIALGFLPKKTGEHIAKKLKLDPDAEILRRLENIEKVLIQDKFFQPQISQKISDLTPEKKQYFADIIHLLQQQDPKTQIHEEASFLELSGNFGTVIIGGVKPSTPEKFAYAISSSTLSLPEHSIEFGGFQVGVLTIGEKLLK